MERPDPDLPQRFDDQMGQLLGPDFPTELAVAVSGGGDSMALLDLSHRWARRMGVRLWCVTVDHGLRAESADEAALVGRVCSELDVPHTLLRWRGWDGRGNLQEAAREARLALIDRWRGVIRHVLMAHTRDDLAETFLIRLKRGSGVEGLSGMAAVREVWGAARPDHRVAGDIDGPVPEQSLHLKGADVRPPAFKLVRPLLEERRETLRAHLRFYQTPWVEDPSNEDAAFDRVRMRRLIQSLETEGLGVDRLASTARAQARARGALQARAAEVAKRVRVRDLGTGDVLFDREGLGAIEAETQLRLMAEGLRVVGSAFQRPRLAALERALDIALSGGRSTLAGCVIMADGALIRVCREYAAVQDLVVSVADRILWDQRWQISGDAISAYQIRALGAAGVAQLPERPDGRPFISLIAQPAIFDGDRLIAYYGAGFGPGYSAHATSQGGGFGATWGQH